MEEKTAKIIVRVLAIWLILISGYFLIGFLGYVFYNPLFLILIFYQPNVIIVLAATLSQVIIELLLLISGIGLIFFKNWARKTAVVLLLITTVSSVFFSLINPSNFISLSIFDKALEFSMEGWVTLGGFLLPEQIIYTIHNLFNSIRSVATILIFLYFLLINKSVKSLFH